MFLLSEGQIVSDKSDFFESPNNGISISTTNTKLIAKKSERC